MGKTYPSADANLLANVQAAQKGLIEAMGDLLLAIEHLELGMDEEALGAWIRATFHPRDVAVLRLARQPALDGVREQLDLTPDEQLVVKAIAKQTLPLFRASGEEEGRRVLLEDWSLPPQYVDAVVRRWT